MAKLTVKPLTFSLEVQMSIFELLLMLIVELLQLIVEL